MSARWSESELELLRDTSLSRAEVASRLGRSESSVKNKCHELGIDRTFRGRAALQPGSDDPWRPDEYEVLWDVSKSLREVSRLTGRSYPAVLHKASRAGVRRRRAPGEIKPVRRAPGFGLKKGDDNPYAEAELAVVRDVELSLSEVADRLGRTYASVKKKASDLGVRRRRGAWQPWEVEALEDVSLTLVEVSERVGRKLGSVYAEASTRGIVRGAQRGEQHYRWAGGPNEVDGHRGSDWPKVRVIALERDGYSCQDCGFSSFNGFGLHVHHVIPYRLWPVNDLRLLVTLCNPCHAKRPEHLMTEIPEDMFPFLTGRLEEMT